MQDFKLTTTAEGTLFKSQTDAARDLCVKYFSQMIDPIMDAEGTAMLRRIIGENGLTIEEPLDDMPSLEDCFGCDPWDEENHGDHAASKGEK